MDSDEEEGIGEFDDGKSGKLTLSALISENLILPGNSVMSIDYLGQTFVGDLLPNGKIKSQETGLLFNNPSAWAIYCKKIINPGKKSGCGWASVKYKGRKMDSYKNAWVKLKNVEVKKEESVSLIPLTSFDSIGKIQPFHVSISSSVRLIQNLHCHLATESAIGYLGGHWDFHTHNLAITEAFPCFTPESEIEIYGQLYGKHSNLAGWYKSNLFVDSVSSSDSNDQLRYQMKMLLSESNYSPVIGMLIVPFSPISQNASGFWVLPETTTPMKMEFKLILDSCLSQEVLDSINSLLSYYSPSNLHEAFHEETSKISMMGVSLIQNFPKDQNEKLWKYIRNKCLETQYRNLPDPITYHFKKEEEEEIDDDEEGALEKYPHHFSSCRKN